MIGSKIETIQISGDIFNPSQIKLKLLTGIQIKDSGNSCAKGKVPILIVRDSQVSGSGSDLEPHSQVFIECATPLQQGSWNYPYRSLAARGATLKDWLEQTQVSEWAKAVYHLLKD